MTVLAKTEDVVKAIQELLKELPTNEFRLEAIEHICKHCGCVQGTELCRCWDDE